MSYELQAIIARGELLAEVTQTLPNTVIAALEQGLALVPITDAFFDGVSVAVTRVDLGFWRLPTGFEPILAAWSLRGPVAYVEAEYFDGVGWQRAAVWSNGVVVLGPVSVEETRRSPRRAARSPRRCAAWVRSQVRGGTSFRRWASVGNVIVTTGLLPDRGRITADRAALAVGP